MQKRRISTPVGLLITIALLFMDVACTQGSPSFMEISGGYSFLRMKETNIPSGFHTGFAIFPAEKLGLVMDVSVNFKEDFTFFSYLFGPTHVFRQYRPLYPFVHLLAGAGHGSGPCPIESFGKRCSTTQFAFGVGGGLDLYINDTFALRLFQIDYIRQTGHFNADQMRVNTGVVLGISE